MAKSKMSYYGIHGPQFKGVVHSAKEYREKVVGQKGMRGKKFETEQDALMWLETFISPLEQQQPKDKNATYVYAVWSPDFQGIVHSKEEYVEKVFGKKGAHGKKCVNEQQAQHWLNTFSKVRKKKKKKRTVAPIICTEPSPTETHGQTIIYIDGGYKNTVGTYGIVAYSSKSVEPIYKDFGYVYDPRFNQLNNTGAELMACLRALEWAFVNNMKNCVSFMITKVLSIISINRR